MNFFKKSEEGAIELISLAKRHPVLYITVGLAIFLVLGITQDQKIMNQLHSWKLLPQPEPLSELYFTNNARLPTSYVSGQVQTFGFTVHNLQGHKVLYHYAVQQLASGMQPVTLSSGSFSIENDSYHKQKVAITPVDSGRVQIRITLQPGMESVSYWINGG